MLCIPCKPIKRLHEELRRDEATFSLRVSEPLEATVRTGKPVARLRESACGDSMWRQRRPVLAILPRLYLLCRSDVRLREKKRLWRSQPPAWPHRSRGTKLLPQALEILSQGKTVFDGRSGSDMIAHLVGLLALFCAIQGGSDRRFQSHGKLPSN